MTRILNLHAPRSPRAVTPHGGKRADLDNVYFRSSWEANTARYLNWLMAHGEIVLWHYEATIYTFPVTRGSREYRPDFDIVNRDESHEHWEVKGWMDAESATKLKRMAKYYPDVRVIVIDRASYRDIEKKVGPMISGWEWDGER